MTQLMATILYQYTMTYDEIACHHCRSRMVVHTRTDQTWLFRCWSCNADLPREWMVFIESRIFDRGRSGMDTGGADSTESDTCSPGNNEPSESLQIVADGNDGAVE